MKTIAKFCTALSILVFISCGSGSEQMNNDNSDMEDVDEMEEGETEREITMEELPLPAADDIKARYSSFEVEEVDEITHIDGSITYDVELKTSDGAVEISYSQAGEYLGIEKNEDDGDDD